MNKYIKNAIIQTYEIIKKECYKPIPIGVLVNKTKDENPYISKNDIYKAVDYLLEEKIFRKNYLNKLILDYEEYEEDNSNYYTGTLVNITSIGSGFILYQPNDESEKQNFFVHSRNLNGAVVGDTVLFVKLIKPNLDPLKENEYAKIKKVLERKKIIYSASYINHQLQIDDQKFYLIPKLDQKYQIENNSKILVELIKNDTKTALFKLNKIIGKIGNKGVDVESIVLDSGFNLEFDKDIAKESEQIKFTITPKDLKLRKDIRDRHIISIDPADSKDMDDAVYVKKNDDGTYFLSVSIADVSYYVQQNTNLDLDALTKCTSVYLVDRVLPMLHHNLSNNICSLNHRIDRFCLTCDMVYDNQGNMISKTVYPAIMNNHDRLSYDIVNEYIENKNINLSSETKKVLDDSLQLYKIIRSKKYKEGYVDLDIKEPIIVCDENGVPIDIYIKPRKDAQKMIEDFMIACNEAVTMIADELELPFIYRVHDKPDITKIHRLLVELRKFNFLFNFENEFNLTPLDISNLLEHNKDSKMFDMLNLLVLKSMQKACYSVNNVGHFGLASKQYTHFTSPIRRYPDLIVHRIFWMYVFDKESYTNQQRQTLEDNLEANAKLCNEKEIAAVALEREVASYKTAEYMEKFINKVYDAKITTITSFGFFVELDNSVEGLVSISSLTDDYYTFDAEQMVLVGKRTNSKFTMGMRVKVKLINSSRYTRKIDFEFIGLINE